tara:strand:- start:52221 stop:52928 length:708 start_codon:yes stop_codon:yes gene_type:complete
MNELKKLGIKHRTDKAYRHFYMDEVYFPLFKNLKQSKIKILEIGCGRFGGSVKTWKDFFINGSVYLFDPFFIRGQDEIGPFNGDKQDIEKYGITVIQGNQLSREDLASASQYCEDGFDFIIDDGAHMNDAIQISLASLFPFLKPKGCYIIEDLNTARRRTPEDVNHWLNNSENVFCDEKIYHKDEIHILDSIKQYEDDKTWNSKLLSQKEKNYLTDNISNISVHPSEMICLINKK